MFAFNFFFIFAPGHNLLALELRKGKSVIPSIFLHVFQVTKKIMVLIFAGDYLMHGKGSSLCFKKEIILVQFFRGFFGTNIILREVASTTRTNNVSVQSTLGLETLDKAVALGLETANPLTDPRPYINSSNLKI